MNEFLENLNILIDHAGVMWSAILLLIVLVIMMVTLFSKQMKSNSDAIKNLADAVGLLTEKVSSPYLDTERSLELFRAIMKNHIMKKLQYVGEILDRNSIHSRENQIRHNIENRFKQITTEEAEKLSRFKSVCGDMGKTLQCSIEWEEFLEPVYQIVFSDFEDHQKISDIREFMNSEVDKIAMKIEENGVHN